MFKDKNTRSSYTPSEKNALYILHKKLDTKNTLQTVIQYYCYKYLPEDTTDQQEVFFKPSDPEIIRKASVYHTKNSVTDHRTGIIQADLLHKTQISNAHILVAGPSPEVVRNILIENDMADLARRVPQKLTMENFFFDTPESTKRYIFIASQNGILFSPVLTQIAMTQIYESAHKSTDNK